MGLGIAMAIVWLFQCLPVQSNFDFYTPQEWCVNTDAMKYGRYAFEFISRNANNSISVVRV
jgi:hypothetical protein